MIDAAAACRNCHDAGYTVENFMPGTGPTAPRRFIRARASARVYTEVR